MECAARFAGALFESLIGLSGAQRERIGLIQSTAPMGVDDQLLRVVWAVISGLLCIACYGRYAEQRYKSTDAAYRHIVILCTPNPFKTPKGEGKKT